MFTALRKFLLLISVLFLAYVSTIAQTVKDSTFKPSGKLWGYAFGDYYYKAHSDSLNRGGANQYTGIEKGRNAFQFRRIYLGYNYDISPKFAAEMVLAAEDNITNKSGQTSGDLTTNNKLSFYIKLANVRWKNIWKGTDLVIGQSPTPAFALLSEGIWGYRSIERPITDIRRVSSFDLGVALQGKFDPATANYGYNVMVSNGTGARPENDRFKWFQGDVYAKLFDKKLILDVYTDYQRLNWTSSFHRARNMIKAFAAYTTPVFTIGGEAFMLRSKNDVVGMNGTVNDTLNANATGISTFIRGALVKEKLGYFARVDFYNPDVNYNSDAFQSYKGLSSNFEPNNKERFFTAGLDFTPIKNVHIMPNIWYNQYRSNRKTSVFPATHDYDLVYRITFHYIYGR